MRHAVYQMNCIVLFSPALSYCLRASHAGEAGIVLDWHLAVYLSALKLKKTTHRKLYVLGSSMFMVNHRSG